MLRAVYVLPVTLLLLVAVAAIPVPAGAQSGGPYEIERYHPGSGTESAGGDFDLMGTAGQSDAGSAMTGGVYTLIGGFWSAWGGGAVKTTSRSIYLPLVLLGGS